MLRLYGIYGFLRRFEVNAFRLLRFKDEKAPVAERRPRKEWNKPKAELFLWHWNVFLWCIIQLHFDTFCFSHISYYSYRYIYIYIYIHVVYSGF